MRLLSIASNLRGVVGAKHAHTARCKVSELSTALATRCGGSQLLDKNRSGGVTDRVTGRWGQEHL